MLTGTISGGVVKILLQGFDKFKAQLNEAQARIKHTTDSIKSIGNAAGVSFAAATGSMLALAKSADPHGFLMFQIAITRVAVQLGSIFVPMMRAATERINQFADFLHSLTDEQIRNIQYWTKMGLAVLGTLTVVGKLVSIGGTLVGTLTSIVSVLRSVLPLLGAIVGLVNPWVLLGAAVVAVGVALYKLARNADTTNGVLGKVGAALNDVWETLTRLWGGLVDAVRPALEAFVGVIRDAFGKVMDVVSPVLEKLSALVSSVVKLVGNILSGMWDSLTAATSRAVAPVERAFAGIVATARDAVDGVGQVLGGLLTFVKPVVDAVGSVVGALLDVVGEVADAFTGLFNSVDGSGVLEVFNAIVGAVEKVVSAVFGAFSEVASSVVGFVSAVFGKFKGLFNGLADGASKLGATFRSVWDSLVAAFEKLKPTLNAIGGVFATVFGGIAVALGLVKDVYLSVFNGIADAASKVAGVLGSIFGGAIKLITNGFNTMFDVVVGILGFLGEKIGAVFSAIGPSVGKMIGYVTEKVVSFVDTLIEAFNSIRKPIETLLKWIYDAFVFVVNGIKGIFLGMVNAIVDLINAAIDRLNAIINRVNEIAKKFEDLIKIPEVPTVDPLKHVTGGAPIPTWAERQDDEKKKQEAAEKEAKAAEDKLKAERAITRENERQARLKADIAENDRWLMEAADKAIARQKAEDDKANGGKFSWFKDIVDRLKSGASNEKGRQVGPSAQNPRFMAIAEAMKAVQQSTVPTVETAAQEERNKIARDTVTILEKIEVNTAKKPNLGLAA